MDSRYGFPKRVIVLGCAESDEQMSSLDDHFHYLMTSKWATRWGWFAPTSVSCHVQVPFFFFLLCIKVLFAAKSSHGLSRVIMIWIFVVFSHRSQLCLAFIFTESSNGPSVGKQKQTNKQPPTTAVHWGPYVEVTDHDSESHTTCPGARDRSGSGWKSMEFACDGIPLEM